MMCDVLHVSRSGYYSWKGRPESKQSQRRKSLETDIREVHSQRHKDNFGSPRVYKELKKQGVPCSENMVARVMQEAGIQAQTTKKFKVTTDSNHEYPVAENLLNREFDKATKPREVLASDITYVWTQQGWLYVACVLDLYTRKIIGWSMSSTMTKELVLDALRMALLECCPGEEVLHHSDRGSQYCSHEYQQLLRTSGITCSMSRKGDCWDNAMMESFFATLKKELVHQERYETRDAAKQSIFEYIEVFYNCVRLHSSLGYVSPAEFEEAA